MAVFLIVGVGVVYWSETAGNPILSALGVDPVDGQSRGQGGPLRPGDVRSVHYRDERHQHRRGQLDVRFLYAARRHGPDVQPARRLHLARRRRRGTLRLSRRRDHRGVRRRTDGRPHAGISGQEDRNARDEARDAGGADLSARGARFHGRFGAACRPRSTV